MLREKLNKYYAFVQILKFACCNVYISWRYDQPVVLIFTVTQVIPVTKSENTLIKNLKKNNFPEV